MHGSVGEWSLDRLSSEMLYAQFHLGTLDIPTPKTAEDILGLIEDLLALQMQDKTVALPFDPIGVTRGDPRAYRGGSYSGDVVFSRSAARREQSENYTRKTIGFRVDCELKKK